MNTLALSIGGLNSAVALVYIKDCCCMLILSFGSIFGAWEYALEVQK